MLVFMIQNDKEQSDQFRGRYLNMAIEGMEVLQGVLSEANVRISILEQEKDKPLSTELPPWLSAPREPEACGQPKEEISIEPESRFTLPEEVK